MFWLLALLVLIAVVTTLCVSYSRLKHNHSEGGEYEMDPDDYSYDPHTDFDGDDGGSGSDD